MKKVTFNEDWGYLVDEEGNKFECKRFSKASAHSHCFGSRREAENSAENRLLDTLDGKDIEAYEVTSLSTNDSGQEYDPTPFSANITAILYKN